MAMAMTMAAVAAASQLASVVALSSARQVCSTSGSRSTVRLPLMPAIECAKHAQKKATAHHNKTRPKKHNPYDKNRQGPTLYPAVAKPPPIWGLDSGDAIPDICVYVSRDSLQELSPHQRPPVLQPS